MRKFRIKSPEFTTSDKMMLIPALVGILVWFFYVGYKRFI